MGMRLCTPRRAKPSQAERERALLTWVISTQRAAILKMFSLVDMKLFRTSVKRNVFRNSVGLLQQCVCVCVCVVVNKRKTD